MTPAPIPHNADAEACVIGTLFHVADASHAVFAALLPDDFWIADHRVIFSECLRLHRAGKPISAPTFWQSLRDGGRSDQIDPNLVSTIIVDWTGASNLESYIDIVREQAKRRKLYAVLQDAASAALKESSDDVSQRVSTALDELGRHRGTAAKSWSEAIAEASAAVDAAMARRLAGGVVGVPTGLRAIDERTGGLQPGRLYGIAARPGCGKTALLNQIGIHASSGGYGGIICSLEMNTAELVIRGIASVGRQNVTKITLGHKEEADAAFAAGIALGDIPLWIDEDTQHLAGICAQIALHRAKHGIAWAAVDHIGLVETERCNNRNDQVGLVTRTLKRLAKRLSIPIIALSQLNRASETGSRRPGLHDLRDSGNIEQDLDVAIFLHVDEKSRSLPDKPIDVGLLKNRGGRVGWISEAGFQFQGATQTFVQTGQENRAFIDAQPHWNDRSAA